MMRSALASPVCRIQQNLQTMTSAILKILMTLFRLVLDSMVSSEHSKEADLSLNEICCKDVDFMLH